jgi:hypothetical protein
MIISKFRISPFPAKAALLLALALSACRSHTALVYSGVDPTIRVVKSDRMEFVLPDDASIRERNAAVLLRDELVRQGFHLVNPGEPSHWTLSFGLGRRTYTIGSATHGAAIAFLSPLPMASYSSRTENIDQTDVTIFMHLLQTSDLDSAKPMAVWEGTVTTKERVFAVLPNAVVAALLQHFGEHYERQTRVDKAYQRMINREKLEVQLGS